MYVLGFDRCADDSPNVPMALSTEKIIKSRSDLSVRVIASLSSSSQGVDEWARDLEATQCAKWVWRISERPSSTKGCEGSVWISEILGTGQGDKSVQQSHDARADVSVFILLGRHTWLTIRLSSYHVHKGCSSSNLHMRLSKRNLGKTGS